MPFVCLFDRTLTRNFMESDDVELGRNSLDSRLKASNYDTLRVFARTHIFRESLRKSAGQKYCFSCHLLSGLVHVFPQTALELNGALISSKKQVLFHHEFLIPCRVETADCMMLGCSELPFIPLLFWPSWFPGSFWFRACFPTFLFFLFKEKGLQGRAISCGIADHFPGKTLLFGVFGGVTFFVVRTHCKNPIPFRWLRGFCQGTGTTKSSSLLMAFVAASKAVRT